MPEDGVAPLVPEGGAVMPEGGAVMPGDGVAAPMPEGGAPMPEGGAAMTEDAVAAPMPEGGAVTEGGAPMLEDGVAASIPEGGAQQATLLGTAKRSTSACARHMRTAPLSGRFPVTARLSRKQRNRALTLAHAQTILASRTG